MDDPLRSVWTRKGAIPIVTLPGDCCGLEGLVWEALARYEAAHVIVDLRYVPFLDDKAIASLVRLHLWRPTLMALCDLPPQPARKLRVLGLTRFLAIHPDVDAALEALGTP